MKPRVAILTEIIAPYRTPVFNALAARPELDLRVIYFSETDATLRQWQVDRSQIRHSYEVLKSDRYRVGDWNLLLTRGLRSALESCAPDVIIAGGYNYLASWQAQRWALARARPFLLWSESNLADKRSNSWWLESAKRRFIRRCHSFAVPGKSAMEYIRTFEISSERIFVAPNAVDVDHFVTAAEQAQTAPDLRERLGLPSRYFLYVGRLVRSKGSFDLLEAYATLPEEIRRDVALVLAGDGPERAELVRRSKKIDTGSVVFCGFLQRDQLPAVYALADALVFPTHSDTWGLVVNEALACGLPVIASRVAGCVADLVFDGENGYVVDAQDSAALACAMRKLAERPELRRQLGRRSLELSAQYVPQKWADGIVRAVREVVKIG